MLFLQLRRLILVLPLLGCLALYSCRIPKEVPPSPAEIADFRIVNGQAKAPDAAGFTGEGFFTFRCNEYNGFIETADSRLGAWFRQSRNNGTWISTYVVDRLNPYEQPFGKDTVMYTVPPGFRNATRVVQHAVFTWIGDSLVSRIRVSDTVPLVCEDSIHFAYAGRDCAVYRFSGTDAAGRCRTFYLSSHFGVFKEYAPEEQFNYQRDIEERDQQYELYRAHLYHMHHSPGFHTRCGDGPLFLFHTSYSR